jgi:PAS domain S-box-containing protein
MPDSLIPLADERPPATLAAHLPGMAYRRRPDRLLTVEYASPGCYALTGYRPADFVKNATVTFVELIHHDDRARVHDELRSAIASSRPFHLTFRIVTATGDVKWVWDKGWAVRTPTGEVAAIEGLVQDVTAHVLFERRLRAHEAALEESQRIANVGSWEVDLRTGACAVSAQFWRIIGRASDMQPLVVGSYFEIVHPDDRESARQRFAHLVSRRRSAPLDHRILRPDGEVRHVNGRGRVIADATGAAIQIVGTTQDITSRKQLEQQVIHAQRTEAVALLAGGIAHDFSNLITVIGASADLALEGMSEAHPVRETVLEIKHAADRARALTRQLLTFGRRDVARPRVVDVNHVVREADRMLRRLIGDRHQLRATLEPSEPLVFMDPGQLEQLLVNLVVNARDAMPDGGTIHVSTTACLEAPGGVRCHADLAPGDYVGISVSDHGIGMDDEVKSRIFEPFFTTKDVGRGTGLGLSTVLTIVKSADGQVFVDTTPGSGTTFTVCLPRTLPTDAHSADARLSA